MTPTVLAAEDIIIGTPIGQTHPGQTHPGRNGAARGRRRSGAAPIATLAGTR